MDKLNKKYLVKTLLIVVALFIYFGAGAMIDSERSGRLQEYGWIGSISWRLYPTIITLVLGTALGWLILRKKYKSSKKIS